MPTFQAQIMDGTGQQRQIQLHANSLHQAHTTLESQAYLVLSLTEQKKEKNKPLLNLQSFDQLIFAYELRTLLVSGLSISEAINLLLENTNKTQAIVLADLRYELDQGFSLSQALQKNSARFSPLLIATIAASERNGTITKALDSFIGYEEQIATLRSKIYSAAVYPILLIIVAFLVLGFLLMYLVPRFAAIYEGVAIELPLASEWLLKFGGFLGSYRWWVLVLLFGLILLSIRAVQKHGVEQTLMRLLSIIPVIKQRLKTVALSRFYRAFGLLLESGASVLNALEVSASLLEPNQRTVIEPIRQDILNGQTISMALITHGLVTPVSARLLAAGDRNGEIVNMLRQSANFHDIDLSRFIEKLSRLLEPVLMLFIGLFIGLIVVLLYLPIFEMASGIQS